ncbi:hypothetical protein PTKIN_Ptkin11bG0049500 [Pterospermum kingtungense]
MKPCNRKLFLYYDPPYSSSTTTTNDSSSASSPPSSSKMLSQQNPPFDSSMALTIVVLLTALFFMGFFSIYIRRMSEDPTAHLSRRRRYRGGHVPLHSFPFPSDHHHHHGSAASGKGLDPTTVRSLPVYCYHGNAKYENQIDCAICLSEFEDTECVKTIPSCKHIFHVECIDMWLASHVSCPVCRGTKLFEINGGGGGGAGEMGVMQERIDQSESQSSTVEISDTCMAMGTTSRMRRTKSWSSSIRQQAMLRRTLSF